MYEMKEKATMFAYTLKEDVSQAMSSRLTKVGMAISLLMNFVYSGLLTYAADDPFESGRSLLNSTAGKVAVIGVAIAAFLGICYGVYYMAAGEQGKQKAKSKGGQIIAGLIVIVGVATIIGFIINFAKSSGFSSDLNNLKP